ncbi:DUF6194 family protein [Saxibacter everestensis]|uniref:DUF6194 family protein n=1 Tax=Saxibacter everestensis TaxID=2909229 RepID=A0ABY8QXH3_9MICO|nr:DUF6194 family protein [Brevibacteriaceae bacterium ZFBP1038]
MSMEQILSEIRTYDGLLELAPLPGSEHPEISWGDFYFYYAPDRRVPRNRQPYATIVTNDYPGDTQSRLGVDDRWRLNIHVGSQVFTELLGYPSEEIEESGADYGTTDAFLPHPLYGAYGWVCVVNPGGATINRALEALRGAHLADRRRVERRQSRSEASRTE